MKEVLILGNTVEPKVAHALLKRISNIKLVGPDKNNRYQVWAIVPERNWDHENFINLSLLAECIEWYFETDHNAYLNFGLQINSDGTVT